MPTPITPVATWTGTIPTPDDGEAATGAGLDGMAQPLADRDEYLKTQVDSIGVRRVRRVTTLGDLRGQVVTGTGDVCYYVGTGFYYYDSGSVTAEDLPWIVESDYGGRWFHELRDVRAAASGLATLNGSGRLAQLPAYATIAHKSTELSGTLTANVDFTTSSSWQDVAGGSVSFTNVNGNDVIVAQLSTRAIVGSAPLTSGACRIRLAYELLGVTTGIASTEVELQALAAGEVPPIIMLQTRKAVSGVVTWTGADPHIIKAQITSDGTSTTRVMYPFSLIAQQVRP